MTSFSKAGNFLFCWQHNYIQETDFPYFEAIHNLKFTVVSNPQVSDSSVAAINSNEHIINFDLKGSFAEGDKLIFAWSGKTAADCNPKNFLGSTYLYRYSYFSSVWFGINSGTYGIKNYTMDEIQMCYSSNAEDAPSSWFRVKKTTGAIYFIKVHEYNFNINTKVPELLSFYPTYGSTELYESDTQITFNFLSQAVYPSR